MQATVEVTSRSMEHAGKQQIIATVLWKHRLVAAIQQQASSRQAADHSDSAMEAQASGSYPVAADHSNSAMEVHASDSLSSSSSRS